MAGKADFQIHLFPPGSMTNVAIAVIERDTSNAALRLADEVLKTGWSAEVWSHDALDYFGRVSRKG